MRAVAPVSSSMGAAVLPRLYLGAMTFGWKGQTSTFVDESTSSKMLESFRDFHDSDDSVVRIDTARIYSGGDSEVMLGTVLPPVLSSSKHTYTVGSKAHPSQTGGLSPEGLRSQLRTSLDACALPSVGEYYLHQPDPTNSLLESLQCCHGLVEEGLIASVGMSNYHASEVRRAFDLCDEHGLTKPSVYQGLYNPIHRTIEEELLPVLREGGCSFVAYNPLAGGMLTGKHFPEISGDVEVKTGRFKNNPNYLPRFYTDTNFRAVNAIRKACDEAGISMVEASYRWMLRHSTLDGSKGDGLLLGASSMEQLGQNLDACGRTSGGVGGAVEELPSAVVESFEEAWGVVRDEGEPFPYWRSYSSDMPGRDGLDHGASYDAAKKK